VFIEQESLLKMGSTVVVGVSGGVDSIALLHYLLSIKHRWNLFIIVAHVNHMFRGKDSEDDFEFVLDLCEEKGILFEGEHIDVPKFAMEHGLTPQVAARQCRYHFFHKIMEKHRAYSLALGHHGDDQMETIMMRLVRGSYITGLSGIPSKRPFGNGMIIRPFLVLTKKELEDYVHKEKLSLRVDPSNFSDKYARNRFRHHVLPALKEENPKAHERFQYVADRLREDNNYLFELAEGFISDAIENKDAKEVTLSINRFLATPIPLQRRGIHLILKYLYQEHISTLSSIHIESFLRFLKAVHPSGKLNFPNGLHIVKSYDRCTLSFLEEPQQQDLSKDYEYVLSVPGKVEVDGKLSITAEWLNGPVTGTGENEIIIDPENLFLPLITRNRRAGDRIQLADGLGRKKVKDIFIDQKIPLKERHRWPIVTDKTGTILWIPQLKKAPYFPNIKGDGRFILLTYTVD
jgi:tRNA(Ile)-lysidine synthase